MQQVIDPHPRARTLTTIGALAVVASYFILPWGDGQPFLGLRGDIFAQRWSDADFNRKLQEAFGIWGFLVLMALAVVAAVIVRKGARPPGLTLLVPLLIGGALWHQGMIGTVNGLNVLAYVPHLGVALSVIGLLIQRSFVINQDRQTIELTQQDENKAETNLGRVEF